MDSARLGFTSDLADQVFLQINADLVMHSLDKAQSHFLIGSFQDSCFLIGSLQDSCFLINFSKDRELEETFSLLTDNQEPVNHA